MKMTLDFYDFCDAFKRAGCSSQFSCEALQALFDHMEEADPDWELDVIALCCDFSEATPKEYIDSYHPKEPVEGLGDSEIESLALDLILDSSSLVAQLDKTFLIYNY